MEVLAQFFRSIFVVHNEFSERTLEFLAQFVSHMTTSEEFEEDLSLTDDVQAHPFLTDIIIETLKVKFIRKISCICQALF